MAGHPFIFDPPKIDFQAEDLETEWEDFKEHCELIFNGSLHAQTEKVKANTLRQFVGAEGRRIFKTFVFDDTAGESKDKRADIYTKYEEYIAPKSNHRSARLLLQRIRQSESEGIDAFINRLRLHARKCKFKDVAEIEERVIEQLIAGTKYKEVQRKLISKETLTLDEAVKIARNYEAVQGHLADIRHENEEDKSVHAVRKSQRYSSFQPECDYCGYPPHTSRSHCPASGKECRACGKIGHFEKKCCFKQQSEPQPPREDQNEGTRQGGGLRCLSRNRGRGGKSRGQVHSRGQDQGRQVHYVDNYDQYGYDYDQYDDNFESLNLEFGTITVDPGDSDDQSLVTHL